MQEWKSPAYYAVRQFALRCMRHPRLEEDPSCVIATERDAMLKEIDQAELPQAVMEPVSVTPERNGKHRG